MLAVFTAWDWTEIAEGFACGVVFATVPMLAHHLWMRRRHQELRASHDLLHQKLDDLKGE